MAYAYSPGLKILESVTLHRDRRLPLSGKILVSKNDSVSAEQVVMMTDMPGRADMMNIVSMLGCLPNEIEKYMTTKQGDPIKKHELIAESSSFFGLFKTRIESPIDGTIESVSPVTGQITLRGKPIPVEVKAYIDGTVLSTDGKENVVIETTGSFIQGIFGVGGETCGNIEIAVDSPDDYLTIDSLSENHKDKVVIGGSYITYDVLMRAKEIGVKAIIVGGFDDADLKKFLGFDLGVAITGQEKLGLTLVITEGFGKIPMAAKTFDLLRKFSGMRASVNGATQIRAGVMRPEIIIPQLNANKTTDEKETKLVLEIGKSVRVIREPFFGKLGIIKNLPVELTKLPTESKARVLEVEFENGERAVIPRANVEVIATD